MTLFDHQPHPHTVVQDAVLADLITHVKGAVTAPTLEGTPS